MLNKGDTVLVCSSQYTVDFFYSVCEVIRSVGLRPIVYDGVVLGVRESTLDKEIRDDFYNVKVRVIFINDEKTSIENNWAIPELKHCSPSSHNELLVYIKATIPDENIETIQYLDLSIKPIVIRDTEDFVMDLKNRLEQLLI